MTRCTLLAVAAAALAGCDQDVTLPGIHRDVTLSGIVLASRDATVGAGGLKVSLRNDAFAKLASTTTQPDGAFEVAAPSGSEVHLVITGDGLVPIAFGGETGRHTDAQVPYGQLWAFRPEDEAEWRTTFAGCPGADDGAGMIVGITYLALDVEDVMAAGPPWPYSRATLEPSTGDAEPTEACYLQDVDPEEATPAHDPDAWRTGVTGRFAFFGVEGGPWKLTLMRCTTWDDTGCLQTLVGRSTVFVPDGGVVERTPALVPF